MSNCQAAAELTHKVAVAAVVWEEVSHEVLQADVLVGLPKGCTLESVR